MKFTRFFLIVGFLALHTTAFGMNEQKKQDAIEALSSAMDEKINIECANGKRKVLLYDWTKLKARISDSDMFAFLKAVNKAHKLGFDADIQNIENGVANPFENTNTSLVPSTQPTPAQPQTTTPANPIGMNEQKKKDAISLLSTAMKLKSDAYAQKNWSILVPDSAGDNKLVYLKRLNAQLSLGFDTVIKNIENSVANPFENTNVTLVPSTQPLSVQPQVAQQPSPLVEPTWQELSSINKKRLALKVYNACKDKDHVRAEWEDLCQNNLPEELFTFATNMNQKYNLGFDGVINNIEYGVNHPFQTFVDVGPFTQEDIRNAIAEEPTGRLNSSDDEEGSPGLRPISFTDEQKRNAQLPYKSTQYQDDADKPGHTTTRFSRRPVFFGIIALCAAAGICHYWQDQKKKQKENTDADSHEADAAADY